MKSKLQLLLTFVALSFFSITKAQHLIYTDTFTQNAGYCSGSSQWDNWGSFRSSLDTTTQTLLKLTVRGTFDQTGRSCTDLTALRRIATALRTAATFTTTCGGFTWTVGNCGSGPELNVGASQSTCACNVNWCVRPQINCNNPNWGGIGSNTCSGPTQRMTVIFEKPTKDNDLGVIGTSMLDLCTYNQGLTARIYNSGTNRVDSFRLYWSINGTTYGPKYVTSRLARAKDTQINLFTSFTFAASTNYAFKIWTHRPNDRFDSIPQNDTFRFNHNFIGNPLPPSTTNFVQCGQGRPRLRGTPNNVSDSLFWYDAATGGNFLGVGSNILGPYLTTSRTFYAQAVRLAGARTLRTTFAGTTPLSNNISLPNGAMFDVVVARTTILDSLTFKLNPSFNNGSNTDFLLYIKSGTHVGFETNQSAWTLINSGKITFFTQGGNQLARISCRDFLLASGQTYGVYYTTSVVNNTGGDIMLQSGVVSASNSDITINPRICIYGLFGSTGTYLTWSANVELKTKLQCTNSTRTALNVTVKPRPIGANIQVQTPSEGFPQAGVVPQPDLIEVGKTLVYEITAPTGYSSLTNDWEIDEVYARTNRGFVIPSYEFTLNKLSNSATVTFVGSNTYLDSNIIVYVKFSDLGPHYCDSTVSRVLRVVPTPKVKFTFPAPTCDGDPILFENLTSIHSGNCTYLWDFGDGNTSDLVNPVHTFATSGIYNVKLTATSFPYGIIRDTTIQVEVTDVPEVNFRVLHACEGIAVRFVNQTIVSNGTLTYTWIYGDNSPNGTATNPTKLYSAPGGYKVTLIANANGCKSELTKNAYQFAKPVPNFNVPSTPVCAKSPITFPNTSTIAFGDYGSFWRFGDGNIATVENGTNSYNTNGTYPVKLRLLSEFGCTDSITKNVVIIPTPNTNFMVDQLCSKRSSTLINTTNETVPNPTYAWSISDGSSYSTKNVVKNWPNVGPYVVTLKSEYTNGCKSEITKTVEVQLQPKADFTVADICAGTTARFVNKSFGDRAGIEYKWDLGNGTSTDPNPIQNYNNATTQSYNIQLVASYPGACSDTIVKNLTVTESPVCDFTATHQGKMQYFFTPSNTGYTKYEWFFGEGGTSTSTIPTYNFLYAGGFNVTMRAINSAGCECSVTKRVDANTSVSNINVSSLNIYPNPNKGSFKIKADNQHDVMNIEIFNVIGTKVYTTTSSSGEVNIDLGSNAAGVYIVKVTINGVTTTSKVTITNN